MVSSPGAALRTLLMALTAMAAVAMSPWAPVSRRDGARLSRIVPVLQPGAGVVTTRNHVHYVVTEHGVADLYGKTLAQRAEALIGVAAPEFRETLARQARELRVGAPGGAPVFAGNGRGGR